jgi:hypothetical protein
MGKRELVLIAVFVVLGICVYQVTAPPPPPGSEGVSLGGIFRNMKRGIQGARESATADSQQTVPVDAALREVRVNVTRTSDLTVTGEDRADVSAEFHVTAHGFDQAEAKAAAEATRLKLEQVGDALVVSLDNASARSLPRNSNVGQIVILLKVPRRLGLRMEPHSGRLIVSRIADAEIMGSRGDTSVMGLAGRLVLTHSGGPLELDDVPALKLNARNSRGTVKHVNGPMTLDAIGGELAISEIAGPLEIEARNTDMRLEGVKALKGPLRINTTGGELRVDGLRTEARIDGRNTRIEVALAASALVTIYNLGAIRVTPPAGGYTLDAAATEGRITMDDEGPKPSEGNDQRAAGAIRGGGPILTLRATRGSITIEKPGTIDKPAAK